MHAGAYRTLGCDAPSHCWRWIAVSPTVRGVDEHTPDQPADETSVTTKAPRATRTSRTAAATTGETPSTAASSTPAKSSASAPTAETPTAEPPAARTRTREAAKEAPETPATDVHTAQLPTTTAAPVTSALPTQPVPPSPARPARPRTGDLGTRRTEPLPVDRTAGDRTAMERGGLERGAAVAEPTVPTNIYRARRPIVAVFLVIPAVAVGLLLIRALAISAFGPAGFRIDGVIASSLALSSLPLLVAGLYGLITGAAHGSEHYGFKVWARPPLAYLLVGIAFVTAAGIAIR